MYFIPGSLQRFASARRSKPGLAASSGVSIFVVPMMRFAAA